MREAADIVRYALDLGITFIDTARLYGTEPAVGAALQGRRDGVVVSTKVLPLTPDARVDGNFIRTQIDDSLVTLGLDAIDIVHLHGVTPRDYRRVVDGCLEALQRARSDGKIRHIGITELWNDDLSHDMLQAALDEDHFDAILVGCNMLNSTARRTVLPRAQEQGVATLLMFAVRRAFADQRLLQSICSRLVAGGQIDADLIDLDDPLGFLICDAGAATMTEAAYRYCRHLQGANVVLTGTSQRDHLRQNIAAIEREPLPRHLLERVDAIFANACLLTGES